jgi:hypothetical protein
MSGHVSERISFCFEHNGSDIRKRHHGEFRCENWRGPDDDPCYIRDGLVVEILDSLDDAAEDNQGLGIAETPEAATDDQPHGSGDSLGPCGCVDYHMADCPLLTDRGGEERPDGGDWWSDDLDDAYR